MLAVDFGNEPLAFPAVDGVEKVAEDVLGPAAGDDEARIAMAQSEREKERPGCSVAASTG